MSLEGPSLWVGSKRAEREVFHEVEMPHVFQLCKKNFLRFGTRMGCTLLILSATGKNVLIFHKVEGT